MKTTIYLFLVLFGLSSLNGFSQSNGRTTSSDSTKTVLTNLEKLSQDIRKKQLVKLAKEATLRFMPAYYRDVKPPVIRYFEVSEKLKDVRPEFLAENKGRFYYTVTFLHDPKEEYMREEFAGRVYIWEDTGFVFRVQAGNGWGYNLEKATEEQKNALKPIFYEKSPPMTIVKDTTYDENGKIKEIHYRRVD